MRRIAALLVVAGCGGGSTGGNLDGSGGGVDGAAMPMDAAPTGCGKDTDCKGDRICVNGMCVSPGGDASAPPDQAAPLDQSMLDQSLPDLAAEADLAQPDLAQPDLAAPQDLSMPDLTRGDLATPSDLAMASDQSIPSDLSTPSDLTSMSDLALSGDLATQPDLCVTTITGKIVAPTPLTFGAADPIYGALVYVPSGKPQPFTPNVACTHQCNDGDAVNPLASTTTLVDGTFTLVNPPCGQNVTVEVRVGRWRRVVTVANVACCGATALPVDQTRLPRKQAETDPLDNIPLTAIVTGDVDSIECVLRKMGVDESEFVNPGAGGRVQIYLGDNAPGVDSAMGGAPSEDTLWGNQNTINKYDQVIFACQGSQLDHTPQSQQTIINYANAGGRLFVDHYSYVWLYDDAPFSTTANWNVDQAFPPDPLASTVDQTTQKGQAFAQWLHLTGASPQVGQLSVNAPRHDFDGVIAPSRRWLYSTNPAQPLHYSFDAPVGAQPANQCGRVHYADLHSIDAAGNGFLQFPQECNNNPMNATEKAIEFLLFDAGGCS